VPRGLTGSTSPDSKKWNDAIDSERTYTNGSGTFSLTERDAVADIAAGDILAAEYSSGGASGHTMVVSSIALTGSGLSTSIPNVSSVNRYEVEVYDSTSSVHGNFVGSTDSRYLTDLDGSNNPVNDKGIGTGRILIFADASSGALVGWTWNTTSGTVYQGTDSTQNADSYRPMVAGFLSGPGL